MRRKINEVGSLSEKSRLKGRLIFHKVERSLLNLKTHIRLGGSFLPVLRHNGLLRRALESAHRLRRRVCCYLRSPSLAFSMFLHPSRYRHG